MNNENKEFDIEMRTIFSSFLPWKVNQLKIRRKAIIWKQLKEVLKTQILINQNI